MDHNKIAKEIIENNMYLSIATSDGENSWIAPLFYTIDEQYNFYFVSAIDSVHAQHIQKNPHVAIAIFDSHQPEGTGNGVQIKAKAGLVDEREYPKVMEYFQRKLFPDEEERAKHPINPKEYSGTVRRIFKIEPLKCYVQDTEYWKVKKIDRRIEVKLRD